uniref:BESS domain-containing protein n=1 Tax=Trichogramma kaykai TaxID=54128 RepID=A0ABD2W567_9HYME
MRRIFSKTKMISDTDKENSNSLYLPTANISQHYIATASDEECRALFEKRFPQLIELWDAMEQKKAAGVTCDTGFEDFGSVRTGRDQLLNLNDEDNNAAGSENGTQQVPPSEHNEILDDPILKSPTNPFNGEAARDFLSNYAFPTIQQQATGAYSRNITSANNEPNATYDVRHTSGNLISMGLGAQQNRLETREGYVANGNIYGSRPPAKQSVIGQNSNDESKAPNTNKCPNRNIKFDSDYLESSSRRGDNGSYLADKSSYVPSSYSMFTDIMKQVPKFDGKPQKLDLFCMAVEEAVAMLSILERKIIRSLESKLVG